MPEASKALVAAEQRAERRQDGQHDISGPRPARGHPEEAVEFAIARLRERMRLWHIDRLPREDTNRTGVVRERVMRQVLVEVEGCHPRQPSARVEVPHRRQWGNLIGS